MREIRQSGSEVGGNEQTVSPYPYQKYNQSSMDPRFYSEGDEGDEGAGLVVDFRSIIGGWRLVRMPAFFKTSRRASTPALPESINKSTSCVVRTCF
jgi:hypothetical protein